MADLRESIRTFVEDLPNILSRVKDYSMAFDDSLAMHECSADLYIVSTSCMVWMSLPCLSNQSLCQ